jgi:hypothetical protein
MCVAWLLIVRRLLWCLLAHNSEKLSFLELSTAAQSNLCDRCQEDALAVDDRQFIKQILESRPD